MWAFPRYGRQTRLEDPHSDQLEWGGHRGRMDDPQDQIPLSASDVVTIPTYYLGTRRSLAFSFHRLIVLEPWGCKDHGAWAIMTPTNDKSTRITSQQRVELRIKIRISISIGRVVVGWFASHTRSDWRTNWLPAVLPRLVPCTKL